MRVRGGVVGLANRSSTLRTIWVKTGSSTCNSSDSGSYILKARIEEQELTGTDKYSSWKS